MIDISLGRPTKEQNALHSWQVDIGKGFVFHVDCNQPTQRYIHEILQAGSPYEAIETRFLMQHLKAGDVFFDVGANCGWFSAVALTLGASVVAFEPMAENIPYLKKNAPGAEVHQIAVGDYVGSTKIYVNMDNDGGHALWPCGSHPWNEETRKSGNPFQETYIATLDTFLPMYPAIIKIDTEGNEYNVLRGAKQLLQTPTLRAVICERNVFGLKNTGYAPEDVLRLMSEAGFNSAELSKGEKIENWIFTR